MRKLDRPGTLTAAVAASIRDSIVNGEFHSGEPLGEVRLAAELGTSRGTVREALRLLVDDGLVETSPHRGSSVSSVTHKRVRDLYELKMLLEPFAVGQAVESGNLHEGGYATQLVDQLARLKGAAENNDAKAAVIEERRLHEMLWSPCNNQLLRAYLATLHLQTRQVLALAQPTARNPREEYEQHERLLRTVLSGDSEAARHATREHLAQSRAIVLARISDEP